jgi:hypothetical protein
MICRLHLQQTHQIPTISTKIPFYGALNIFRNTDLLENVCLFYIRVFQSGFLVTSGFREGMPGVPRNADKSLGILCVVVVIFIALYL